MDPPLRSICFPFLRRLSRSCAIKRVVMVLRRAASTAAYLLIHRTGAFAPPCVHLPVQASGWRRQGSSQRQQQQQKQLHVKSVKASPVAMASSARSDTVFAFDFDGVICNSQGESSRSGFRALARLWPEVVAQLRAKHGGQKGDDVPSWIVEKMGELRPIVETGYENILLVRLLIEERLGLEIPYPSEKLIELWGAEARDDLARRYGLSQNELVDAFGSARDDWIETDFKGWLGANTFYEGVPEAITACEGEVYVVTTKQTRFASALLEHAGIQVPVDRIFGLGTGPKAGVLGELKTKYSGSKLVFLEDRVETLELVCADSELEDVDLYLCKWGFNTAAQRARGESNSRITLIGTGDLAGLLAPNTRAVPTGEGR